MNIQYLNLKRVNIKDSINWSAELKTTETGGDILELYLSLYWLSRWNWPELQGGILFILQTTTPAAMLTASITNHK